MIHNQLIIDDFADDFDYDDDDDFTDGADNDDNNDDDEEASWYLTGRQPMVKSLASSKNVSNKDSKSWNTK